MNRTELELILQQTRDLRDRLRSDIDQAVTRNEHQRLAMRAAEATQLAATIETLLASTPA